MTEAVAGRSRAWRHWVLGALCLTTFLVPIKFGLEIELWEHTLDFLHLPAFAVITLYLYCFFPAVWSRARRMTWSFILASASSGMVEILQQWTGRQASFWDFFHSTVGAFVGILWLLLWPRGTRARLAFVLYAALCSAAIALPAWRAWKGIAWRELNFPLLSDFESKEEFRLWWADRQMDVWWGASISPSSTIGVTHGLRSARIAIIASQNGNLRIFLADQDWRPYHTLAFDVFETGDPIEVSMRIDDNNPPGPNDRFYRALKLVHGWNHLRIPLSEIQYRPKSPPFNLAAVRRIVFFREAGANPDLCVFYLDWLHLE